MPALTLEPRLMRVGRTKCLVHWLILTRDSITISYSLALIWWHQKCHIVAGITWIIQLSILLIWSLIFYSSVHWAVKCRAGGEHEQYASICQHLQPRHWSVECRAPLVRDPDIMVLGCDVPLNSLVSKNRLRYLTQKCVGMLPTQHRIPKPCMIFTTYLMVPVAS